MGRLFRMGWPEIACRSRQEAYKWIERVGPSAERSVRSELGTFFAGVFDSRLPSLLAMAMPDHCKELLAAAEKTSRGSFDLLGYRDLDFGNPPDWHLDPIAERRAPLVHWSRLNPMDFSTIGDSKIVWELNRHQWLVQLGQAYALTHDEVHAAAVTRYLRSWLAANPVGVGINWASSLEVAFRLIAWSWTLFLIRDSESLTPELSAQIVASAEAHARHIERYLSYYFSPNTHLTGEALGLFYASVVFHELPRAKKWQSLATEILIDQIKRQILPDGVYFERSTCYQRYTIDIYTHFFILASRAGIALPPIIEERLRLMLDFLLALQQPDGTMPSIGDADGGSLLPLSASQPHDVRPIFSTAAVMFESPQYAWAARDLAPETLWLLGTTAAAAFQNIEPAPPALETTRAFPDGGYVVMRNNWTEEGHCLILDTGPLGCDVSSGHGHADLLSVQCSAFGEPYLVDTGTCCYTASEEIRNYLRGTAAHNTVRVDGRDQAQPGGPFAWQSHCAARLVRWTSDFAEADHDGYDPVTHRRRVIFRERRYWILIDDLTGPDTHHVEVRFQFAPVNVRIDADGWVRATRNGERGLLIRAYTTADLDAELREGRLDPMEGWISPNYGRLESAPALVYTATAQLPLRIITVLWPSEDVQNEKPSFDPAELRID